MFKRLAAACAALSLLFALTACGGTSDDQPLDPVSVVPASIPSSPYAPEMPSWSGGDLPLPDSAEEGEEASEVSITMLRQEYSASGIVELPAFAPERGNAELAELNEQMAALAEDVSSSFVQDGSRLELRAYPFTSGHYLQVVMTQSAHPAGAAQTQVYSFVYNSANKQAVDLAQAMSQHNLRTASLAVQCARAGLLSNVQTFVSFTPCAFRFSGEGLELFARVAYTEDGGAHGMLVRYFSTDESFSVFDPACAYAAHEPDAMEPPLAYGQAA